MNDTCTECPYLRRYTECNMMYHYAPEEESWYKAAIAECTYLEDKREIVRVPYDLDNSEWAEEKRNATPTPSWCKLHDMEDSHFMRRFMHKD